MKVWMILGEHEGAVSILKLKGQKALCSMSNRAQTGPQPSFGGSSSQWRSSAALAITVALCKTCSWLLITSRKPCSNPAPCSPECNLLEARVLQTMRASFPRATALRGLGTSHPSWQGAYSARCPLGWSSWCFPAPDQAHSHSSWLWQCSAGRC